MTQTKSSGGTPMSKRSLPAFAPSPWQMSTGERLALEGALAQLKPALAIEIGTAEGGSLSRIVAHSEEVHSFDLVPPQLDEVLQTDKAILHTGDSHVLLPAKLAEFAAESRNVDFVLVDGDHSAEGVRKDLEDLLDSEALQHTVILIHDINNPEVRRGVDAVDYDGYPKVALVELDCVPGYLFADEALLHELWGGLGMILVDATGERYFQGTPMQQRYFPAAPLFEDVRDRIVGDSQEDDVDDATEDDIPEPIGPIDLLEAELSQARELVARQGRVIDGMKSSVSWKLTAPLRAVMALVRRFR